MCLQSLPSNLWNAELVLLTESNTKGACCKPWVHICPVSCSFSPMELFRSPDWSLASVSLAGLPWVLAMSFWQEESTQLSVPWLLKVLLESAQLQPTCALNFCCNTPFVGLDCSACLNQVWVYLALACWTSDQESSSVASATSGLVAFKSTTYSFLSWFLPPHNQLAPLWSPNAS